MHWFTPVFNADESARIARQLLDIEQEPEIQALLEFARVRLLRERGEEED